jgi:putative nucleotidyltransferase with HDIG domain
MSRDASRAAATARPTPSVPVWLFVGGIAICGVGAVVYACATIDTAPLNVWTIVLAALTLVSSRFVISVPGQPATVSVSEVFVFASILLFGPAPAVLTVAADGLCVSLGHRHRRWYRTLFNIAEPAVSTCVAGAMFFAAAHVPPFAAAGEPQRGLLLPSLAMSVSYFLLNTLLQAAAVSIENGVPLLTLWRQHAGYVAVNYYAAGSLATLAVRNGIGIEPEVVGLTVPLLVLSYGAYKAVANRVDDAQRHVKEIEHLYEATVETLAIAVDAKDQVTHGHIRRVQRHTVALAKALGITDPMQIEALKAASLLHDIGKLAVPDYVLNKPGALSASEFDQMKLHATTGAMILSTVEFPYPVVPIVRHHHEQWCGKGYPDGLAGDAIPLGARILTVVDCFDAVTSDRPYRRKLTDEEAVQILRERSGIMYDPRIVDAFIALVPELRREDQAIDSPATASPLERPAVARMTGDLRRGHQIEVVGAILREALGSVLPGAEACFFEHVAGTNAVVASRWTRRLGAVVSELQMPIGEGLVGWVAAHRHTIVNSNADLDLGGAAAGALELAACSAVPVFACGALVGVLAVYLPRPRRFSADDVRRIGLVAQEIGTALLPDEDSPVLARVRSMSAA